MRQENTHIENYNSLLHQILSDFAMQWDDEKPNEIFEKCVAKYFGFQSGYGWNILMNSIYIFQDTELAKSAFQNYKFDKFTSYQSAGERYLVLYGFLNACYQQAIAMENLLEIFKVPKKKKLMNDLKNSKLIQLRNKIGAHPSNHLKNRAFNNEIELYEISRSDMCWGKIELLKDQNHFETYNLMEISRQFDNLILGNFKCVLEKIIKKKFNNQGKNKAQLDNLTMSITSTESHGLNNHIREAHVS